MTGHAIIALLKTPLYLFLIWLAGVLIPSTNDDFTAIFIIVVVSIIACTLVESALSLLYSVRQRQDEPHSISLVLLVILSSLLIPGLTGWLMGNAAPTVVAIMVVFAVVNAAEEIWLFPSDSLSRAEIDEKKRQTRDMTKEVFADEIDHAHKVMAERNSRSARKHHRDS